MTALIGLDIGTTGCKAIVFDPQGAVLGAASAEYNVALWSPQTSTIGTPRAIWAEQDAEEVWRRAWETLCTAVSSAPIRGAKLAALALSVQGEAVIPVDDLGHPIRRAILGMDTRTAEQNIWLAERFGAEELFRRTGMPIHTVNTLPKLLWLKQHEPGIWRAASRFLLYEDYILNRLGGMPTISHCLASRTQMYDLIRQDWADDLLAACGIERERLSPLALPCSKTPIPVVGKMHPNLAAELGLGEVLLVSGGHDQACAALGSGVCRPGLAMVSTGTAEVVEVALAQPALSPILQQGNISIYRHVVPGQYLAMTLNHSGGLLLRWLRDTLFVAERDQARACGIDPYEVILSDLPKGPTRLFVLPHFAGSGTPWFDLSSKGAILGLTFDAERKTIAKAVLEGLTFELRINLDLLRSGGVTLDLLHAVGGGARSAVWLQLKADICNKPLRIPAVTEAACLGAALLAGVGASVYEDLQQAVAETVHYRGSVEPCGESVAAYAERYAIYRDIYPTLRSLNARL
ncbi:MAG: hypothetical protein H5T69_14985 [Chloroflexi bacterium]|nr:hypothetical protein [Chloroflexota bacterium]